VYVAIAAVAIAALLAASKAAAVGGAQELPRVAIPINLFSPAWQRLQIPVPRLTAIQAVAIARREVPSANLLIAIDWHRTSGFVPRMTDGTWLRSLSPAGEFAWFITTVYKAQDVSPAAARSAAAERPFDAVSVVQVDEDGRITVLGGSRSAQALLPWIPRPQRSLDEAAVRVRKAFTSPAVVLGLEWSKAAAFRSRYNLAGPHSPVVSQNWHPWHHENPAKDVAWFATVLTSDAVRVVRVADDVLR
jgi:hypothetical protein